MRERLLPPQAQNARVSTPDNMERQSLISSPQREANPPPVGTVVKVSFNIEDHFKDHFKIADPLPASS